MNVLTPLTQNPPKFPPAPPYHCALCCLLKKNRAFQIEAGHSGMGGLVGILVGFELRVSGHSLKPTEYEYIVVCFKSYVFMVKNEF